METEDLLQQMELHQLQNALNQMDLKQQELELRASDPWDFVHWIGILISAIVTFVIVTLFVGCLRRVILQKIRDARHAPNAPPPLPMLELPRTSPAIPQAPTQPIGFFRT